MNHLKTIVIVSALLIVFGCSKKSVFCPEENNIKVTVALIDKADVDSCYLTVINISKSDTLVIRKAEIIDTSLPFIVFDEYLLKAEIIVKPNSIYKGSKRLIIDNKTDVINILVSKVFSAIKINIIEDTTESYNSGDTIYYNDFEAPLNNQWETNYKRDSLIFFKGKHSLHSNPDGVKLSSRADAILDINLAKTLDPVLSFWARPIIGSYYKTGTGTIYDKFRIYISTDLGVTWKEIYTTSTYNQEFSKTTLELSAYRGEEVKIKFQYATTGSHSSRTGQGVWVDEVMVVESPRD